MTRLPSLIIRNQNLITLDLHFENSDAEFAVLHRSPSFDVDLPAVPRADDQAIVNHALSERASAVRTHVVERAILAIDVCNAKHLIANRKLAGFAFFGKFRYRSNFDPSGQWKRVSCRIARLRDCSSLM